MSNHFEKLVDEMLKKMSTVQKVALLKNKSRQIKKLGIKQYDWWNEALHGVGRAGVATVFPQAIAMAATFDENLIEKVGDVVSTEARAKYNKAQKEGDFSRYKGLTFWSPNINIYRDPRWGRGQETYGEDPYLTSRIGVAYIKGLQGYDAKYLKVAACAKHFAVHSGPEKDRHTQNVEPTKQELFDTYLRAFEAAVKEAKVESVMSAYNSVYGEPCSSSKFLLDEILRKNWGFCGHVVSDCGAIGDIIFSHKTERNPLKAAARAINAGCDLECGAFYALLSLSSALKYVTQKTIDNSARRLLMTRAKLGMFDDSCPYDKIDESQIAKKEHQRLSLEVAEKSVVLLKNDGVLPLNTGQKIAVIGPNAKSKQMLLGNYEGTPPKYVTVYDGICLQTKTQPEYAQGCDILSLKKSQSYYDDAVLKASQADVVVLCLGLDSTIEGEEGDADRFDEDGNKFRGDRESIELPESQITLLEKVLPVSKKTVILNFSGGAVTFKGYEKQAGALLQCWYPGALGGQAIGEILFKKANPCGRLSVTFYASDSDLPDFSDYSLAGRTYRFFKGEVLYPFGFGLSYSSFKYEKLEIKPENGQMLLQFNVLNVGQEDAEEVVQVYVRHQKATGLVPNYSLKKIQKAYIQKGEGVCLQVMLDQNDVCYVDENGEKKVSHDYTVYVGGVSPHPDFFDGLSISVCENRDSRSFDKGIT